MRQPVRPALLAAALCAAFAAQPAPAQFFWSPPDLSTPPVTGAEPSLGLNLPGATPEELNAGLVWNLRAALNVAALQCDFEPTLLTVSNYNATIAHHSKELQQSFDTLGKYFQRTVGKGKPGQQALDQYGTRIYSGYSTVQAQRNFCQTAGSIGRDAIFTERGKLFEVARKRMGELKKSLVLTGERYFGSPGYDYTAAIPPLNAECWKKGKLLTSCKAQWDAQAAKKPAGG
ncbi:MAG: hypothetical protein QHC67_06025 [Sphingobium sp.]|uniref:hypothetical protein n=1 Tax=Sphingobium sp. TaxID=1912891 RepID=UPI0029AD23FE|nr:hypothetical protein [Sphingobium sp.]MDX3909361.1 hypothetical protein [Sphingobium sp.]